MVSKKDTIQPIISIPCANIYIYISGNTCVCLVELFWSLIYKMQYFEMYIIKWSHFLEGNDGLGRHTLKFCLINKVQCKLFIYGLKKTQYNQLFQCHVQIYIYILQAIHVYVWLNCFGL